VQVKMKDSTATATNVIGFNGLPVQLGANRAMVARNVTVAGRRTSVRLEPEMWESLQEITTRETITLHQLCTEIARQRGLSSLTAAIRAYALAYFRAAATERGHRAAGHGGLRRDDDLAAAN
ncbi:MAG TPA: ribbon-helix-helix domain-containing protein, partial [Dongiaceae bacterium]